MADAEAFALDDVLAGGGDVDQQVDEVVLEQVDLVDIEEAAVGAGEQSGFEGLFAAGQGAFEVEGADDSSSGGAEREIDDGNVGRGGFGTAGGAAFVAGGVGLGRIAMVAATGDDLHGREKRGQGADGGGFAGAAVAERQDAADRGIDGLRSAARASSPPDRRSPKTGNSHASVATLVNLG